MAQQSVASTYAQTAIESAPPLKIIHLMYEGALRFLEQAKAIDKKTHPVDFTSKLNRAEAIVSELRISLDPTHAPLVSRDLTRLYLFVEYQIQEAMHQGDVLRLDSACSVLTTLLDGWKQLEVDASAALRPAS